MELTRIAQKHNYQFPPFFKRLWEDGMLDWYKGWNQSWSKKQSWYTSIYPSIKDAPPALLHTGGFDFEMLSAESILNYEWDEWWDTKHQFIPFARNRAGDVYAIYANIQIEEENPIVLIWHDDENAQILAKNFEDFIFRKMVERVCEIQTEEIERSFEGQNTLFQKCILADLKSICPYLKKSYQNILTELYNRSFKAIEKVISIDEMNAIFKQSIHFDLMDTEFVYVKDA